MFYCTFEEILKKDFFYKYLETTASNKNKIIFRSLFRTASGFYHKQYSQLFYHDETAPYSSSKTHERLNKIIFLPRKQNLVQSPQQNI